MKEEGKTRELIALGYADGAVFQGLAHGLQGSAVEFRKFVQENNPLTRAVYFAFPGIYGNVLFLWRTGKAL